MDKFLNLTAVQVIKTWAKSVFASKSELSDLSGRVDEIVAEGGEPNVIEKVMVNGTSLTPDSNKAVDVIVPTRTSTLTNDGEGDSKFATEYYVDTHGGKIDVIKVNGTSQTITDKTVDIAVPTKLSELTNDADYKKSEDVASAIESALANNGNAYQTQSEVEEAIQSAVVGALKPKGTIGFANLPSLSAENLNNVYNISDPFTTTADFVEGAGHSHAAGSNVAIINTGTDQNPVYKYDVMVGQTDLSAFWTSTPGEINTLEAATTTEINNILNAD